MSLLFLCKSFAQNTSASSTEKEKKVKPKKTANPSFRSVPGGRVIQAPPRNQPTPAITPVNPPANTVSSLQSFAGTTPAKIQEPAIQFNYQELSTAVRHRIDANKTAGRKQWDGIGKRYDIETVSIQSLSDFENRLSSLHSLSGMVRRDFVSPGKISIVLKPEVSSEKLKEALSSLQLSFDFLKEEFILIQ